MVCEEYHDTRNVLDKSLEEICRNEKVLPHQVFSIFFFSDVVVIITYGSLCFTITNQRLNMMLLILGSKHSQKQQKEKIICESVVVEIDKRK